MNVFGIAFERFIPGETAVGTEEVSASGMTLFHATMIACSSPRHGHQTSHFGGASP